MELLNQQKRPADLQEVVDAIEAETPAKAEHQFQKSLREQLMAKHAMMVKEGVGAAAKKDDGSKKKDETEVNENKWNFGSFFSNKGWSMAVAVLLIVLVSGVISYPLIPAPEVQGYTIRLGVRKVSYNAPIKIVFTQPMDHGSAEKAFKINPQIEGTFKWENNSMLFYPKAPFKIGDAFTVSLDNSARSFFQKPLTGVYEEVYDIVEAPEVVLFSPQPDSNDVPVDAKITVHFDRPMVALTTLDQGVELAPKFVMSPQIQGRYKWLGTNTVSFIPDHLPSATHFSITVPKGTPSADGGSTEKDFAFSFNTLKPAFASSEPANESRENGPETIVHLNFNQVMNLGQASSAIHFWKFKGDINTLNGASEAFKNKNNWEPVGFDARYYSADDFKKDNGYTEGSTQQFDIPEITELQKTLILKPKNSLPFVSLFAVEIDKNFSATEGELKMDSGTTVFFRTVGDLKILNTDPDDNGNQRIQSGVNFTFSNYLDAKSIENKVFVEPKIIDKDTGREEKPVVSTYDNTVTVRYPFKAVTKYSVTLKAGVKDRYGQTLAKDSVVHFTTDPLDPSFDMVSSSDISVLDANKPSVYYVKTTNVKSLNVNFKALTDQEFNNLYARGYVQGLNNVQGPFTTFTKAVELKPNEKQVTALDLDKELNNKLQPGYYFVSIQSPEVYSVRKNYCPENSAQFLRDNPTLPSDYCTTENREPVVQRELFIVTSAAIATKQTNDQLLVWATSMKDGSPVSGMTITAAKVIDVTVSDVALKSVSATTDKDGLATFDLKKNSLTGELFVIGRKDGLFAMTHSGWSDGISPWNFDIDYTSSPDEYLGYVYTDRPIYRPEHTVYFKGIIRQDNDAKFKTPDFKTVKVKIEDPQSETIFEKDLPLNANGTFNGELTLATQARVGSYSIQTSSNDSTIAYQSFQVAEYRKPEYKLDIEADKKGYVNGDKAQVTVKGAYFFGAPLPNAEVEWTVKAQDYYYFLSPDSQNPYASEWYSFSEDGYSCYWGCEGETKIISQGKSKLNAQGEYTISLPLNITDKKISQLYTLEATVSDLNRQSVSNRVSFPVHQGEYYVGVMTPDSIAEKGKDMKVDVISVDADGKPVGGKTVDVSLFKRDWNSIKKKNVDSDFYYENNFEDVFIEKRSVVTDPKGYATVNFRPKDSGSFKVLTETRDTRNNKISSATMVYVSGGDYVNWGVQNNDRIELVPDKQEYKVGDTAKVLIKSPYQNVHALVTYERAGILKKDVIKLDSNTHTLEIKIQENYLPNIFVSVLLMKGSGNSAGMVDPGKEADEREVAAFKLGYATLQVDTSAKKLNIDVQPNQQKYHPGETVKLKVKTTDLSGNGKKAEVSLSVVDESVLTLTDNVTADLLNYFYRKRFLGVSTGEMLTKALSRLNVQVESGLKGGGGGGVEKRGDFKDTAYWNAVVMTNEAGEGEVEFKLPDNLTTWQVLAIGTTNDTLVGSQKADFLVTKDVLLRPVLPRFMIVEDSATVGAIVHNYLDQGIDVDVSLQATGVKLNGPTSQRIHLNSREEKRVEFPLTVLNETEATFNFKAIATNDQNIGDIVEQKLPIQSFSFPEVVASSTVLTDNAKYVENIWLPVGVNAKFGELTVSAASTLAGTLGDGLKYLVQYPYGCAEQTASALLPNLAVKQVLGLPTFENQKLVDIKDLDKKVSVGLQALYKYQKGNGGWGIWETSEPTPYLTAYVLYTLHQAQASGYTVDSNVMKRGVDYLNNYISGKRLVKDDRFNANTRAFALYVLSEMNKGDLGLTNNLYDFKANLNLFSKSYVVMTYDNLIEQNKLTGETAASAKSKMTVLTGDILNTAKETPRGVHFEENDQYREYALFDTNTRTTALVLQMLARTDMENPLVQKILRYMLMEKRDGHYASTQETAVSLFAMVDYLKLSKELEPSYNGTVEVNGKNLISKSFTQKNISEHETVKINISDLLPNNQDNELVAAREGVGKMYLDINLKYFVPGNKIASRDEGILVTQDYYAVGDTKMQNPLTSVKAGQNLMGKMTVVVPEDRYYVMVEDYLPAGLEGVDFSLKTSQQGLQDAKGDSTCRDWDCWMDLWRFNYSEVRDDRMMFFADFLPKGVYELKYFVRATTPGTFHDLPALAQELYFPEVFGRSAGREFTVVNDTVQ